jgi:hypothetical protein
MGLRRRRRLILLKIASKAHLAASGNLNIKEERGGKILLQNGDIVFANLQNVSTDKKRFYSEIPEADFFNDDLIGFWHTHPGHSYPSPPDLLQMLKINLRFKRNFLMVIIGRKKISITHFTNYIFPHLKLEKLKTL